MPMVAFQVAIARCVAMPCVACVACIAFVGALHATLCRLKLTSNNFGCHGRILHEFAMAAATTTKEHDDGTLQRRQRRGEEGSPPRPYRTGMQ